MASTRKRKRIQFHFRSGRFRGSEMDFISVFMSVEPCAQPKQKQGHLVKRGVDVDVFSSKGALLGQEVRRCRQRIVPSSVQDSTRSPLFFGDDLFHLIRRPLLDIAESRDAPTPALGTRILPHRQSPTLQSVDISAYFGQKASMTPQTCRHQRASWPESFDGAACASTSTCILATKRFS